MSNLLAAAQKLHSYMVARHWRGNMLIGPDPGVRFNYRIWRFAKSRLPFVPWGDSYCYVQAQGYWVLGNWYLYRLLGNEVFRAVAVACSQQILARQEPGGEWAYPNPEWRGRIATAEGTWASLGLLESYRHTGDPSFLAGATRWHRFLDERIGYRHEGGALAVNYFAGRSDVRVPNNSVFVLRFLAELADATGNRSVMAPCKGLLAFIAAAQRPDGELPYITPDVQGGGRPHFQCFQYNAFQCLDLMAYYRLTGEREALRIAGGALHFLTGGLGPDGAARYDCDSRRRTVTYHTAALAAAFAEAVRLGMPEYEGQAWRAYQHVLGLQQADGGFPHSRYDYGVLDDRRSYPRYLAMIMCHLLITAEVPATQAARKEGAFNNAC